MASGKEIKSRLKSIKNTKKTTKAMELVAGAKMRKAVLSALDTRTYHSLTWAILQRLKKNVNKEKYAHLKRFFVGTESISKVTIVVFTSNRGLCGAFNANVVKQVLAFRQSHPNVEIEAIAVGKKGAALLSGLGVVVHLAYEKMDSAKDDSSVVELAAYLHERFSSGETDQVLVAYTDYKSAISQIPVLNQLYPILSTDEIEATVDDVELRSIKPESVLQFPTSVHYIYEPYGERLLSFVIPRVAQVELYQALLESNASEHSSRMVAMKNATEAAGEMAQELTLEFNRARQASITKEIAEITAGSAAVA